MNNQQPEKFQYSYTAPTQTERREIQRIRDAYAVKKEQDGFARLQALHNKVQTPPRILAITLGVLGTLLFGAGLACILEFSKYVLGAILAAAGIFPLAFAYPVWKGMITARKKKYSEQIITLSNSLLDEKKDD